MLNFFGTSSSSSKSQTNTSRSSSNPNSKPNTSTSASNSNSPIVVTTVKKQRTSQPSTSTSTTKSQSFSHNRLPEQTRRRIENDRKLKAGKLQTEIRASQTTSTNSESETKASSNTSSFKKRRVEVESEGSDATTSEDDDDDGDYKKKSNKRSVSKSKAKKSSGNAGNRQGTDELVSVGSAWRDMGRKGVSGSYNVKRQICEERDCIFFPDGQEEKNDGEGNSDMISRPIQSADVVRAGGSYKDYFMDLPSPHNLVSLSYPAIGAKEDFLLLVSKDADEYDPISELLRTINSIVANFLTPEQRKQYNFGDLDMLECGSLAGMVHNNKDSSIAPPSPAPSSPHQNQQPLSSIAIHQNVQKTSGIIDAAMLIETPEASSVSSIPGSPVLSHSTSTQFLDSPQRDSSISSVMNLSNSSNSVSGNTSTSNSISISTTGGTYLSETLPSSASTDPILRSLTKARNRRSGPLFIFALKRFNQALEELKKNEGILKNVRKLGQEIGVVEGVWRMIQEQCYARTVGPKVEKLGDYTAFSDNVYGELLPKFLSEVLSLVSLKPSSIFADLGSGVGNLLIQASLQTGASSYGVEQMTTPSEFSSLQLEEAKKRWRMWCLKGGDMKSWQGDFSEQEDIRTILKKADVVVVNNYAFTAATNDVLSLLFLDLPEGARIVSLKPFVPPDFRLTERSLSSPRAILKTERRRFVTGCVSWMDGGGSYYIHTIDRSMIKNFTESRAGSIYSSRDNSTSVSRNSSPNVTSSSSSVKKRKSETMSNDK